MPVVISTAAIAVGQAVRAGDVLLSIEAMKMETARHAEKDGTVADALVRAGAQIDAKDLLTVWIGGARGLFENWCRCKPCASR